MFYLKNVKKGLIYIIKLYQKTISPDHGFLRHKHPNGFCKYYPSCSEYMIRSLDKFGLIKGFLRGFNRILRCNPLSKGGVDEP